jgi:hypothetical protein
MSREKWKKEKRKGKGRDEEEAGKKEKRNCVTEPRALQSYVHTSIGWHFVSHRKAYINTCSPY